MAEKLLLGIILMVLQCVLAELCHSQESNFDESRWIRTSIKSYCGKCHTGTDAEAELDLSELALDDENSNIDLVQDLIRVVELKEMPPEDAIQPDDELRNRLLSELRRIESRMVKSTAFLPTPIRRMNRFQYNNAVIDLFELKCNVFTLPERIMREHGGYFRPESGKMADVVSVGSRPLGKSQMIEPRLAGVAAFPQDLRAENGFDNRGDHLSLSPLLMESFLKLGKTITESPDFVPKNVGVWKRFFAPPKKNEKRADEVRRRLTWMMRRAFRRPAEPATLDRYVTFANDQLAEGVRFELVMKTLAGAIISSPNFLYLYDVQQEGQQEDESEGSNRVNDFDLASRLSFFLWGSIPDEELLSLAESGTLAESKVLEEQVARMLRNRKIKRFCDSFPAQWLQLERIISSTPDRSRYPDFYFLKYRKSMHMMLEPLLLFETVLIENLPITQLVDSDFTYRSKLLEQCYGELASSKPRKRIHGGAVTTLNFHRVPIQDRRTGGVITNAAVMTMTSGTQETKPVTRGAWVAAVIFNDPPEPPPADVPVLPDHPPEQEANMTLRERFALHRNRADCRACHQKIDPLGFALEQYNAIGVWRTKYENERDIDVSGKLFQEHEFGNVIEFKDAILAEKDRFARGLAGHLLSFALARELGPADQPVLDEIVAAVARDNFKIKTLIQNVVISKSFLTATKMNAIDLSHREPNE